MDMQKEKSRSYKIADIVKDGERFVVDARFFENGKEVGRINQAFPLTLSEKEIEVEVKKACEVYFSEKEKAVIEKVRVEEDKKSQAKIDNLKGKESKI